MSDKSHALEKLVGPHNPADASHNGPWLPEHKLAKAVLERAIDDYMKPETVTVAWHLNSRKWLLNLKKDNDIMSFSWVAEVLYPKDPDSFKLALLRRLGLSDENSPD